MFEVLAFVYDNYLDSGACPELPALHRTLNTLGFGPPEVEAGLLWLEDLKGLVRQLPPHTSPDQLSEPFDAAMRALTPQEQSRLDTAGWGFLVFLSATGALNRAELELVMERALATPVDPLSLEDLKLIVLMFFWSVGREPDALVLDLLIDSETEHWLH